MSKSYIKNKYFDKTLSKSCVCQKKIVTLQPNYETNY